MSFWERVGELIGYSAAAIVLGPIDAVTRHERRAMRKSFVAWTRAFDPVPLESKKPGVVRRAITLRTRTGTLPADVELDVFARRARVVAAIPTLPPSIRATISRGSLEGVRWRRGAPVTTAGSLRADSDTLDADSAHAILVNVEHGGLGALTTVEIDLASELTVRTVAMTTEAAWRAIGDGVVSLADFLAEKWSPSYRR